MLWIWWIKKRNQLSLNQCALGSMWDWMCLDYWFHAYFDCVCIERMCRCIELGIRKEEDLSSADFRCECETNTSRHYRMWCSTMTSSRRLNSPFLNRSNFSRRSSSSSRLYLDRNGQQPKKKILLGISSNHHHSQFSRLERNRILHITHICCVDDMRVCEQWNCLLCSDEIKIFIFNKKNMFWLHNTRIGGMLGSCCDQRDSVIQGVKSQYWINEIILCWAFYCCVKTN